VWCVRLTDSQRDALRALIKAQGELCPSLSGALEGLELAKWDDLPEAELPWDRVTDLASKQGIGEADVIWDLAGMSPPPKRKGASATRRPRSKRARRAA